MPAFCPIERVPSLGQREESIASLKCTRHSPAQCDDRLLCPSFKVPSGDVNRSVSDSTHVYFCALGNVFGNHSSPPPPACALSLSQTTSSSSTRHACEVVAHHVVPTPFHAQATAMGDSDATDDNVIKRNSSLPPTVPVRAINERHTVFGAFLSHRSKLFTVVN